MNIIFHIYIFHQPNTQTIKPSMSHEQEPKTRQETKGKGKDSSSRHIYSQKAVRAKEALIQKQKTKPENKLKK
jgi:hypothetical protein